MAFKLVQLLILGAVTGAALATAKSEAAQQVMNIVNDPSKYNKAIMPYPNRSGPLDVYSTGLIRNLDIDDVNMIINVDLSIRLIWEDTRLTYSDPGVKVRFADVSKFWIPDIFFRDSIETTQMKTIYPEEYIQITHKGEVLYSTRMILKLKCPMDLTRFPHDDQTCIINYASYGFSTKDIVFHFKEDDAIKVPHSLMVSNRFILQDIESKRVTVETTTGLYSSLQVSVRIDRLFGSYLLEWYLPCMCFVVIAFCSELMDVSCLLPRLVLTVGPLLALTACTLSFQQTLASVPFTRAVDLFNGISIFVIFATVLHVIISYYYYTKPTDEKSKEHEDNSETKRQDYDNSRIEEESKPSIEEGSKMKKLYRKLREKANYITRAVIIGFYCGFLFLYFLAYST